MNNDSIETTETSTSSERATVERFFERLGEYSDEATPVAELADLFEALKQCLPKQTDGVQSVEETAAA